MKNSRSFSLEKRIRGTATVFMAALATVCALKPAHGQGRRGNLKSSAKAAALAAEQEERIRKIEATAVDIPMGDKEPLRLSLVQLMKLYNVPALSVAVIDDFRIAWAKGYGTI